MKKQATMFLAVLVLVCLPAAAPADVIFGPHAYGLYNDFPLQSESPSSPYIDVGQGPCFDPTSFGPDGYNRIYLVNDSSAGTNARAGLYSADIYNGTFSDRLALGAPVSSLEHPSDCVVDANGDVYVTYDYTPQVWKVTDPSGAAIETQMLGNYAGSGDDDPYCIDLVQPGFNVGGSSFEPGRDLLVFDNGLDDNSNEAISVLDKNSTAASPDFSTIWNANTGTSLYAATSEVDGYAYIARHASEVLQTDVVNGETLPFINRMKSDGQMERIFLDDATMSTLIDGCIEVNPADGSVWIATRTTDGAEDHIFYRIDVLDATDLGGGDFLATITPEITITGDDGYNVGTNGMAISPDGKFLAVTAPTGRDWMYVYTIPEPASAALLCVGAVMILRRRRNG